MRVSRGVGRIQELIAAFEATANPDAVLGASWNPRSPMSVAALHMQDGLNMTMIPDEPAANVADFILKIRNAYTGQTERHPRQPKALPQSQSLLAQHPQALPRTA